ncbi:UNVERIFIED_CONTAM: oxidative DNA demethylase, partial [Siphonaria sp. JEL0065]
MATSTHTYPRIQPALAPENEEPPLSRKEFRYSLMESLQSNGIADKLKSQLRTSLVLELKKRSLFTDPNAPAKQESNNNLIHKAIDSLIVDYLRRKGCEFSLSVFLPECGLARDQVLNESDVYRVLHVDQPGGSSELVRSYVIATIIKLLESVSKVLDIPTTEKDCQTDMDDIESLDSELRRIQNHLPYSSTRHGGTHSNASLEFRIQDFQKQLSLRLQNDHETQLSQFKTIELTQMRIEERAKYQTELTHLKNEYELRLLSERSKITDAEENQRRWIEQREKELEKSNLELRQKLLEESHRAVMIESQVRAEAEILVKKLGMENSVLKGRLEEAQGVIGELEGFKERYVTQTQEALADFKIGLNKEHAGLIASVQVEKAKIDSEKAILAERTKTLERRQQELQDSQTEFDTIREQLKTLKSMLRDTQQERDEALFLTRDLKLQVDSQSSHTALEFEIHSLKTQLMDAEKMGARRQEEYQNLLKGFMAPQSDLQKEVNKLRKSESRWQRECQELVAKLDLELNRNEELQRKLEEEILRNKELKRDVSELKLLIHRINTSGGGINDGSGMDKSFMRIDMIPNPRDILS